MALRTPLVIVSGQIQQLQASDTLNAPQQGPDVIIQTNNNAGSIVAGAPVYSVANDAVDKAQANASGTTYPIGLVSVASIANGAAGAIATNGVLSLTTAQWDAAFGTTGGLTRNTAYYLSAATAGQGTATAPTTVGQYVVELGRAISTTELMINIRAAILL
jgi:hypothetical protein